MSFYDFDCHDLAVLQIPCQLYLPIGPKTDGNVVVLVTF